MVEKKKRKIKERQINNKLKHSNDNKIRFYEHRVKNNVRALSMEINSGVQPSSSPHRHLAHSRSSLGFYHLYT
jgi:hypothetical protein